MQSSSRASSRRTRTTRNLAPELAAELERFNEGHREKVGNLSSTSRRVADLLLTFPGLAFAIATGYGTVDQRNAAVQLIDEGAPLKAASEALDLPLWLRKLPPEAFVEPLPHLTCSAVFARKVANHVPTETWKAGAWLRRVLMAQDLVGEDFAQWIAWRTKASPRMRDLNRFVLLAAWAWHARNVETIGHDLLRKKWDGAMGYRSALEEADLWKKRIGLAVAIGRGIEDTWYCRDQINGFDFVPLQTLGDFLSESERMNNCLDQYGVQVSLGATRVFSIRRDGQAVADLEIGPHDDDRQMPTIIQLRGAGNRRVTAEIWQACYAWLGSRRIQPISPDRRHKSNAREIAREIWLPFYESARTKAHAKHVFVLLKSGEVLDPDLPMF